MVQIHWDIAKRRVETGTLVKIIKQYSFTEKSEDEQLEKAKKYAERQNLKNYIFKKYYYRVEFSDE